MHVNIKKGRDMSVGFISDEAQIANLHQMGESKIVSLQKSFNH